jgi:leader peptidase (prepilin peptidase)/N-methyltransferase
MTYAIIFIMGLLCGSFLNVCIFRIPLKQDIVYKRSHCPCCGNALKWSELIPVFSFLAQKGRCRSCAAKLSFQYPLVELLNGMVYVWIYHLYGLTVHALLYCLCASALLVISVIDWRTFEIPPGLNLFIFILGLIHVFFDLANWLQYVFGFVAVSGLFLLIYLVTKGRGIGGGDIKLMAAAGFLLGWQHILLAMMIGAISGSAIHLLLMAIKGKTRVLAFGPYLAFGIFVAMLYGGELIRWYLGLF